jgi:ankyrin repeat protein
VFGRAAFANCAPGTALGAAYRSGSLKAVDLLTAELGVAVNDVSRNGSTVLHDLLSMDLDGLYGRKEQQCYNALKSLVRLKGADFESRSRQDHTPLMAASRGGMAKEVSLLLRAGADPNACCARNGVTVCKAESLLRPTSLSPKIARLTSHVFHPGLDARRIPTPL